MGNLTNAARYVRDKAFRYSVGKVLGRRRADQLGITLALDHPAISDRMYYVLNRDYESRDALLASKILDKNSRVLELGASCGFMALHCYKNIGVRDYAMVEANPDLMSLIRQNFALNGVRLCDIPLIQTAASQIDGSVEFTVHKNIWSSSLIDRGGKTIRVTASTIPTIVKNLPFTPDSLIADIEGGELFIPSEHYRSFSKIVLEAHPKLLPDGVERTHKLIRDLRDMGFQQIERAGDSYLLVR